MPVSWMKPSCLLLLFSLSMGHTATTNGPGSMRTAPISIQPLKSDVKSVGFKGERHVEKVQVLEPISLTLECTWAGIQNKVPNITGYWRKDGYEIANSSLMVLLENEQYNLKRVFSIVGEESLGNYSCVFGNQAEVDFILAAPQLSEGRDKPIVSYVGDSVVLECKMEDAKPKPNTWFWYKQNETEKEPIDAEGDTHHYTIKNVEGKTKLTLHNLTEVDSGSYYCGAVYNISITTRRIDLKVITFMEPLKPFLVIVAEVLILVCIILLYERRKLGSSPDTDIAVNTDQANKATQEESGGMEAASTMRQRKV